MLLLDGLFTAYCEKVIAADVVACVKFTVTSCKGICFFCFFSSFFFLGGDLGSELR